MPRRGWTLSTPGASLERRAVSPAPADWVATPWVGYTYGDGHRVTKVDGGQTTVYIYDGAGALAAEYGDQAQTTPCGTCFLTVDQLGSTRVVMDENGNVKARHDYLPWGEELYTASRTSALGYQANDGVTQKFTGKERDGETGLDFFLARYYGSAMGRFTGVDPENAGSEPANPQSWNGYSYALNSPLTYTDPDGMDPQPGDPCKGNPNCVTVTAKPDPIQTVAIDLLGSYLNFVKQVNQTKNQVWNWLRQPRNGPCVAAMTIAGAAAGAGVGMLGLAGGPTVAATEPTGMAIGGAIGWVGGMGSCMTGSGTGGGGTESGGSGSSRKWKWGSHKSSQKAANQMAQRGWTDAQIDEAVNNGAQYPAPNSINPANGATRYVNPTTGRSVVIDNATKEVLNVGGDGFKY